MLCVLPDRGDLRHSLRPMGGGVSKITTSEMECALADYFNYRKNLIVPNICWGMALHECDLFILSQAGYATEVEIKISMADLRADAKKRHGHRSNRIKRLYFALPIELGDRHHAKIMELVPERAGVLFVRHQDKQWWPQPRVLKSREAVKQPATRCTEAERYKIARLGALRIWRLKKKLVA